MIKAGITDWQEEKRYFTENSSSISHMSRVESNVQVVNKNSIFLNFAQR